MKNLAAAALAHYDHKSPAVSGYAFATNLLYRLTTDSEEQFNLRLASPGWRTLQDLQSETMWLNVLRRDNPIPEPRVIPARSGEYELLIPVPGSSTFVNTTLMSWLPGRMLGHYLTHRNLQKMGELFAQLHDHAAAWTPPAGFTTRRFDHWLSRGEENLIVGERQLAACSLSKELRDMLECMHHHEESVYAGMDRSDLRVIRFDLWHDNIKLFQ